MVVQATASPAPTVILPTLSVDFAESEAVTPAVYAPVLREVIADSAEDTGAVEAPVVIVGGPSEAVDRTAETPRTWWQSGAAMLVVCLAALAPFSSRRRNPYVVTDVSAPRLPADSN